MQTEIFAGIASPGMTDTEMRDAMEAICIYVLKERLSTISHDALEDALTGSTVHDFVITVSAEVVA